MAGRDGAALPDTACRPEEPEVLVHRQQWCQGVELGRVAEARRPLDAPTACAQQACAELKQGRLAGAVGSDNGDDLAAVEGEVDAGQDCASAAADGDARQAQDDGSGRGGSGYVSLVVPQCRGDLAGVEDRRTVQVAGCLSGRLCLGPG